jgi:hypothetical protein
MLIQQTVELRVDHSTGGMFFCPEVFAIRTPAQKRKVRRVSGVSSPLDVQELIQESSACLEVPQ